ncbi:MAG: MarR family transcriptional regulator [Candidatus Omnitrophica bacterium]|nr:MarR family transcriptional regulator [Candidatus Omnitrophota bacterium]
MSVISLSQFAEKMGEIMPIMMKEFARCLTTELHKGKVTLPQMMILHFLEIEQEAKMKDLARVMGVTMAGMTGIIDRLVKNKLCARIYDPQDRRIIKIRLTAKGDNLVKNISEGKRQMIIKIFGKISETDRQDYLRILLQIKEILLKENLNLT